MGKTYQVEERMLEKDLTVKKLRAEEKKLSEIIRESEGVIKKAPDGHVEIKMKKDKSQFYRRTKADGKHGIYLPASEAETARALVQKNYLEKIVRVAQKQLSAIQRFLKAYNPDCLKEVFQLQSHQRQKLIDPVEIPDDLFVEQWLNVEYEHKGFREGAPEHYTRNHERVRSKSEVLIADLLFESEAAYLYEFPLDIGGKIIHPDYTVLRIRDRKVFYWEHFGMMDDIEYVNNAIMRIREYENCGIFLGESLIITMETSTIPINRNVINRIIQKYLL